jgi:hypothetical protein
MVRISSGYEPAAHVATLRMAFQAPNRFHQALPKEATMSIIWDSGTSLEGQGHVLWAML